MYGDIFSPSGMHVTEYSTYIRVRTSIILQSVFSVMFLHNLYNGKSTSLRAIALTLFVTLDNFFDSHYFRKKSG